MTLSSPRFSSLSSPVTFLLVDSFFSCGGGALVVRLPNKELRTQAPKFLRKLLSRNRCMRERSKVTPTTVPKIQPNPTTRFLSRALIAASPSSQLPTVLCSYSGKLQIHALRSSPTQLLSLLLLQFSLLWHQIQQWGL